MTLIPTQPIRRETYSRVRGRPLIVELHATYLVIGRKRMRMEKYALDYEAIFSAAAKKYAAEQAALKKAARKSKQCNKT